MKDWLILHSDEIAKTLAVIVYLIILGAVIGLIIDFEAAPQATLTTTHNLPYLPANHEVVEGLTNVFSEQVVFGGAGGVGLPQIELSLDSFKQHEDPTEVTYLIITDLNTQYAPLKLEGFSIHNDRVFHAVIAEVPSPTWGKLGLTFGSYMAVTASLQNDKLIVQRTLMPADWIFIPMLIILVIVSIIYWVIIKILNDHFVWWI